MKKRNRLRTIFLILLLLLVAIQFLPVDRSTPALTPAQDFLAVMNSPGQLGPLIKDGCYDCHSHETEYPWYSYVAPVGQWLQGHIRKARKQVNFSVWTTYSTEDADHALKEIVEVVKEKEMPLKSFTWMHPEARLTEVQRTELATWFQGLRTGASDNNAEGNSDDEGNEEEGE